MSIFFAWVLPYIVLLVFVLGLIHRILVWAHIPVPFKLTVFPSPDTTGGAVADLAKETVGLRSLWRGGKGLWLMAWIFHISLALIVIGHIVGISLLGQQFTVFGVSPEESKELSVLSGTYAGIGLCVGLILLTLRRAANPKIRRISSFGDFLVLFLLLGIAGSGMYMRLVAEVGYEPVRDYIVGLLTFHPVMPPDNPGFLFHFALVQLLLLYFPYSKLMHSCGVFLSRWLITKPHERQVIMK